MILSGSCAAFATLIIFVLMFMHVTHLSEPNEQTKSAFYHSRYSYFFLTINVSKDHEHSIPHSLLSSLSC
jgi:hypothetical protein